MTRDRLSEFLDKADKVNHVSSSNQSTFEIKSVNPSQACDGAKQQALDNIELENILSQVTEVWEHVNRLKTRVDKIKSWYGEALSLQPTKTKKRNELDDQIFLVKNISGVILTKIRGMELDNARAYKSTDCPALIRIRKTQCSALELSYIEIMYEYHLAQTEYEDIMQACEEQQVEIAGAMFFEYDMEMEGHGSWTFITPIEIIERENRVLVDSSNRKDDISKLENSVRELHELLFGMSSLVESQGEILENRVERNMVAAQETIKTGKGFLQKASQLKKKWFS